MNITVLMGGSSSERDVSLVSGLRVAKALRERGHKVRSVDTATGELNAKDEQRLLDAGVKVAPPELSELQLLSQGSLTPAAIMAEAVQGADVVFLALHGGQGEDGTVQALLDLMGVVYTGSGHLGSALAMDKDLAKHILRAAGVPTPDWLMAPASITQVSDVLGFPVVVKPSKQGSTVGLSIVKKPSELQRAIQEANRYDDEVMIERYIAGRELTVSILGNRALAVGEIIPKHEIYDYECKYTPGMAVEEFPARLSDEETAEVQRLAVRSFDALKLRGYARIDFRMAEDGSFHCLEANTLPGLTQLSLVPQAAAAVGMDFPELCEKIVLMAAELRRVKE